MLNYPDPISPFPLASQLPFRAYIYIHLKHVTPTHDVLIFICTDLALVSWSYPNLLKLTPRPLSFTPVHASAGSR